MSKEVLLAAFKKAETQIRSSRKTHKSKQISDELWNKFKFQISERSLRDYYNYYRSDTFDEEKELKPKVTKALCQYLGFDNYEDFILINKGELYDAEEKYLDNVPFVKSLTESEPESEPQDPKGVIDKASPEEIKVVENGNWIKKIIIIVSITLPVLTMVYIGYNWQQKECMIWSVDRYKKAECNSTGVSLKYNQDWMDNFKKVQNDTIETFFKQGDTLYWYYKRNNKVELFTKSGMHPTENVRLKPITETIVRNYILKE